MKQGDPLAGAVAAVCQHERPVPPRRTPMSYRAAWWRCTLPQEDDGAQGIAFDLQDGTTVRLLLSADAVRALRETLAAGYEPTTSQSPGSPLMSSSPRSMPSEGVN